MKELKKEKPMAEPLATEIIHTDPFGSYTGLTKDYEEPVQDADDL